MARLVTARTHLVVMPSFDTGPLLVETVREAAGAWPDLWVVIDGSRDGSDRLLRQACADLPGLRVLALARNGGKGAALLHAAVQARAAGFTHMLTMDADGQHPADHVAAFMATSQARPDALVLGRPVFSGDAPMLRVRGRRVSNWWARLETPGCDIGDSLFGFRVYPIDALVAVMRSTRWMRRFDFEPEAAVRLCWRGLDCINLDAPVRYLKPEQGGVSHFRYGRDNLLLGWMHARLVLTALVRRGRGRRRSQR